MVTKYILSMCGTASHANVNDHCMNVDGHLNKTRQNYCTVFAYVENQPI
jgi:hypothetical protein